MTDKREQVAQAIKRCVVDRTEADQVFNYYELADQAIAAYEQPDDPPMVEKVARALYESDGHTKWATTTEVVRDGYRRNASDALRTIAADAYYRVRDLPIPVGSGSVSDLRMTAAAALGITESQLVGIWDES